MFKAPGQLPPLSLLLDDIPTRCAKTISRHLGISTRTLKRYQVEDQAPRFILLALFFETRWGRSIMDSELEHRHRLHMGYIDALKRENAHLQARMARLADLLDRGDYGAANSPIFDARAHFVHMGPVTTGGHVPVRLKPFDLRPKMQASNQPPITHDDSPCVTAGSASLLKKHRSIDIGDGQKELRVFLDAERDFHHTDGKPEDANFSRAPGAPLAIQRRGSVAVLAAGVERVQQLGTEPVRNALAPPSPMGNVPLEA
ncbi:hypothetical protein [Hydrogenophaga laconesensis]|uniref:Uncharacterized protein n=1 Tax=Hydrogenophaga laconesensis TaxID=1805971 RepID=A0ABU1VDY8_9BURK|nr:hypothetical protein [Hydrogenophaga laconesensis]MDR7095525.1 hypothetical protein [Hydrogenophaga laconesensis]